MIEESCRAADRSPRYSCAKRREVPASPTSPDARWAACHSNWNIARTTELNRIIMPNESGQLSVGPDVKELKTYHRCPSE
jgi:hypothetical protein